ncbi:uncharacterized protein LOC133806909 [Humulus lupulus]|uniref:uncharacterized protein LOC133806909 n=1 Tax=Humulus lupulus TaxID=3486 RepID=UPI002B4044B9|nr:uncharacterized protein LOC133806909 [Humulus lupulus]
MEVHKIIHLQMVANQQLDAFIDTKRVTKSFIPAINALARINIPTGQHANISANTSMTCLKHGRPFGSKDKNPRRRRELLNHVGTLEITHTPMENLNEMGDVIEKSTLEEVHVLMKMKKSR